MAIKKLSRATIILPDGSSIQQNNLTKAAMLVEGGEHIVRQDVLNGYGVIIESPSNAVGIDRTLIYNKEEIGMIENNITKAYKKEVVDRITDYETDHVSIIYATKEEVLDLQTEAMTNYTLKTVTNQVWTTSVTTFATKKELDEIAKKYGIGMVIMGSVPSMATFTTDYEYSADNPKRFQGETYFTSDLKHMWQFVLKSTIIAGPQLMIDKVNGFDLNVINTSSVFQIWLGREHANPDEDLTIKFGGTHPNAKITLPGSDDAITEITVKASMLSPKLAGAVKLELKSIATDTETGFEEFITFTTYAGAEEVPQVLALTSPIYFNGYVPVSKMRLEARALAKQNVGNQYKISSASVAGRASTMAVLPGDEFIGASIDGIYGSWVNIGPIVGPPNELIEEILVTNLYRDYVTVAGSQPDLTKITSTAKVLNEYPNQQIEIELVEGVQGAPGVRGFIGNKITPEITVEIDPNNNREVQMLSWGEFDWSNKPIEEVVEGGLHYEPNNPNSEYTNLPEKIRIEGLDAYEVWKDYYARENSVDPEVLTKDNFLLDITGDSAFKFWRDYIENKTQEEYDAWVASIPGFGERFTQTDVENYLAYQKGDVYIPEYDEATGVVSYKFVDSFLSPEEDPSHNPAINGWRVRGQVYEPTINFNSGEISFIRKNEESSLSTIPGVNIRGNVWVPSVNTDTGELSWTNTRDTNNPADVTPTYIYGPIYEPVINYSTVDSNWTPESGFTGTFQEETETLTWQPVRKPTSLQTSTNIKGLKGSPVKVELNLVNDVETYDEFSIEISAPSYSPTPDHIGVNTQTLSVFTPFDRHNLKIHDASGTAWFVGVDEQGRLVTSNTPFQAESTGMYAAAQKAKMNNMRKQIEELKATINLMKED